MLGALSRADLPGSAPRLPGSDKRSRFCGSPLFFKANTQERQSGPEVPLALSTRPHHRSRRNTPNKPVFDFAGCARPVLKAHPMQTKHAPAQFE